MGMLLWHHKQSASVYVPPPVPPVLNPSPTKVLESVVTEPVKKASKKPKE